MRLLRDAARAAAGGLVDVPSFTGFVDDVTPGLITKLAKQLGVLGLRESESRCSPF